MVEGRATRVAAVRAAAGWEVVAKAVAAREVVVMGAMVVAVALVESAGEGTDEGRRAAVWVVVAQMEAAVVVEGVVVAMVEVMAAEATEEAAVTVRGVAGAAGAAWAMVVRVVLVRSAVVEVKLVGEGKASEARAVVVARARVMAVVKWVVVVVWAALEVREVEVWVAVARVAVNLAAVVKVSAP